MGVAISLQKRSVMLMCRNMPHTKHEPSWKPQNGSPTRKTKDAEFVEGGARKERRFLCLSGMASARLCLKYTHQIL